jgi:hypothetical protein
MMIDQTVWPTINPRTTVLDRSFADNRIILIYDHMPMVKTIHLSRQNRDRFFQNTIIDLFDQSKIDYKEKIFVFDSYMCFDDFSTEQSIFTNRWLFDAVQDLIKMFPNWSSIPKTTPTKKLSAIMNKVRPNRLITSMVLANMFDPNEINYSFSLDGATTTKITLDELLLNCGYQFDTHKLLSERWAGTTEFKFSFKKGDFCFEVLYREIFSSATVSIVTEPTFFENGAHLSEKTLMSVYAGHFMIWVGSYKAAECAKRLGLDIFEDIIDHSYQYIEHPGKRSVEAILRNIDLLTNLDLQIDLRNKMYQRLDDNLKLMRDLDKLNDNMRKNFNSHNLDMYDYFSKLRS